MSAPRALAALIAVTSFDPAIALAQQVELDWRAPSGCMSEAEARGAVIERIGRDPFVRERGQARIVVSPASDALLRFELEGPRGEQLGERVLRTEADCRAIDREIAIVLSLLVEVGETEIQLAIPRPPEPAPPPSPARPAREAPPAWRLVTGARAVGALGLFADASAGAEVFAGIAAPPLEVRVEALGAWGGPTSADELPAISAFVLGGAIRGCAGTTGARVTLAGCGVLAAGLERARGQRIAVAREVDAAFVSVGAGGRLDIALADFLAIEIELDAVVPLTRPRFLYDDGRGLAFEPWPVAPVLAVGLWSAWET